MAKTAKLCLQEGTELFRKLYNLYNVDSYFLRFQTFFHPYSKNPKKVFIGVRDLRSDKMKATPDIAIGEKFANFRNGNKIYKGK